MISFWCGNGLLEEDFKKTKTCQNIRGKQVVRLLLFCLQKINEIDN